MGNQLARMIAEIADKCVGLKHVKGLLGYAGEIPTIA